MPDTTNANEIAERIAAIEQRCAPSTIEPTTSRLSDACVQVDGGVPYLCGSCFACKASRLLRLDIPWLVATIRRLTAPVSDAEVDAAIMGACAEGLCHACPRWFDLGGGCACRCHVFRDWQADAMQSHGVKAAWFAGWDAALDAAHQARGRE
jgi:hypothetical protein